MSGVRALFLCIAISSSIGGCATDVSCPDGTDLVDGRCRAPCTVETCNGADDDCDGVVDETDPVLGAACLVEDGTCGARACDEGRLACAPADAAVCAMGLEVPAQITGRIAGTVTVPVTLGVPSGSAVTLEMVGLPEGVTAEPVLLQPLETDAEITINTAHDAAHGGPIPVAVRATGDELFAMTSAMLYLASFAGVPDRSWADDGRLTLESGDWSPEIYDAKLEDGRLRLVGTYVHPEEARRPLFLEVDLDGAVLSAANDVARFEGSVGCSGDADCWIESVVAFGPGDLVSGVDDGEVFVRLVPRGDDVASAPSIFLTEWFPPTLSALDDGRVLAFERGDDPFVGIIAADGASFEADMPSGGAGRVSLAERPQLDAAPDEDGFVYHWSEEDGLALHRRTPRGEEDPSFGAASPVRPRLPETARGALHPVRLVVEPSGRVTSAITYRTGDGDSTAHAVRILRWTPDGELDTTFGEAGIVTLDEDHGTTMASLAVLADGSIVGLGVATTPEDARDTFFLRLLPDGTPSPDVGANGRPVIRIGDTEPDGKRDHLLVENTPERVYIVYPRGGDLHIERRWL